MISRLTIVINVFVQHFHSQNTANLCESLQMIDVNNERPNDVVENGAKAFHVRSQLRALNAEELVEQAVLVLANVDQECAGRSQKGAVIAFVLDTQIFDCIVDAGAHDECSLGKIKLVQFGQQVLVLGVLFVPIFDQLYDPLDFRGRSLELAVKHGEGGFRRLVVDLQRFLWVDFGIQHLVGCESQNLHNVVLDHLNRFQ